MTISSCLVVSAVKFLSFIKGLNRHWQVKIYSGTKMVKHYKKKKKIRFRVELGLRGRHTWYSLVGSEGARMTWPRRMVREKLGLALVKTLTVGLVERPPVLTWWLT